MERTRRPRRAAATAAVAVAVALAVAMLTGCSAGFDATSTKPYAASDGIQATSGDISILNALVVRADIGTNGVVSATVANRGDRDDRLTDLTSPDGTVALSGSSDLAAGGTVTLGAGTDTEASVTGLSKEAGEIVRLTFSFARAEPITLRTVVVAATGDYADLTSSPAASTLSP